MFLFHDNRLVLECWGPSEAGDLALRSAREVSADDALAWLVLNGIPIGRWPAVLQPAYLQRELKGIAGTGLAARHGPDFRSVRWFGQSYQFSPAQAAIVRLLWTAWENDTPEVGQETLLAAAGSEGHRVKDLFKADGGMHPAWTKMIIPGPKGTFRLSGSPSNSPSHPPVPPPGGRV